MQKPTEGIPRLLTATEVSQQIGLSRFRIYELVREQNFPAIRLGRSLRFDENAVGAFLRSGGTSSTESDAA